MTIDLTLERPLTNLDVRVVGVGGAGCSALRSLGDFLPDDTRFLGIDTGTGTDSVRNFAEFIQVGDGALVAAAMQWRQQNCLSILMDRVNMARP